MSRGIKLLLAAAILVFIGYIVASSMGQGKISCEVCVSFRGNEACRTARGPTREEAIRTAQDNACARIASGRTESILCSGSEPTSIRCGE